MFLQISPSPQSKNKTEIKLHKDNIKNQKQKYSPLKKRKSYDKIDLIKRGSVIMYQNSNNDNYNTGTYQPATNPVPTPMQTTDPAVEQCVDAAFGKSLAATIMCGFPVASIIAIIFGSTGLNLAENAKVMAAQRGVKPSGKNVAATVLGKIGKIAGIVMTAFWGFYLFIILMIIATA